VNTANQITSGLLIEIPKRFGGAVVMWRNNRIKAKAIGRGGALRMVSAGVDGQADLSGIAHVRYSGLKKIAGVRVEIEVKGPRDRQSPQQRNFQQMIESHGGIYLLARDAESALAELETRLREYYPCS
jgi:hypothetical protein